MRKILNSSTGFTLIETLIAILILTIGILAVSSMFPLGIGLARSSKMTTIAIQLAQEKIEEIISKSYTDILSEPNQQLLFPFNAYFRKTEVTCFDPNESLLPDCPNTGIKKIEVTVSWGIEKNVKISTLISQR